MGRADYLEIGTWNALCDRCQRKYKANQLRKEWTGWMVCDHCWEPRHPQEFLRGHEEDENVDWTRPEINGSGSTITVDGKTLTWLACTQITSIPGDAVPGCAIPGFSKYYTNPL